MSSVQSGLSFRAAVSGLTRMALPTVDVPQPPWTYDLEIALFRAIISYRPIGLHKSLRLISLLNAVNSQILSPDPLLTLSDIKAKLESLYNIDAIEEAEESEESTTEEVSLDTRE